VDATEKENSGSETGRKYNAKKRLAQKNELPRSKLRGIRKNVMRIIPKASDTAV
jgi:hypothetical protein